MPSLGWIIGTVVVLLIVAVAMFLLGILYRKKVSEREISSAEEEAKRIINESIKSAESKKREALLEAKEEIHKIRTECDREVKERRADLIGDKLIPADAKHSRLLRLLADGQRGKHGKTSFAYAGMLLILRGRSAFLLCAGGMKKVPLYTSGCALR